MGRLPANAKGIIHDLANPQDFMKADADGIGEAVLKRLNTAGFQL